MLSKSETSFSILFSGIVSAELICGSIDTLEHLHYIFKPAIVVSLLIFFWMKSASLKFNLRLIIVLALLFSLTGDLLLMFVDVAPNYFLFGLVSFLLAHIMYCIAFLTHRNKTLKPYGFIAILLIYASGLFYLLKGGLNDMLIPVIVYMLVILSMSTTAFLRKNNVVKRSYIFVFLGALMFMVSDSILALNKFYAPLAYSNISIMLTYALAQFFIIIGILKLSKDSR
ncbi:lysoplasmalogenase [Flavobacteriales bacterium 33_180_T64]|nr:lysoplasmalogenase [Flavobacteriales bacterium 33_180_T64]